MSILKTKPLAAAVKEAVATHNRKLGGAKGRLHQQATRLAAEAKAQAATDTAARAAAAIQQIDREIAAAAEKVRRLRIDANNARGGPVAVTANKLITELLAQIRDLRAERATFLSVALCC